MTADESDEATSEEATDRSSRDDVDDDAFGARLGEAYRDTVGSETRTARSSESTDGAVDATASLDGVGGGPDRVVSDRSVDEVLAEMGDDDGNAAGTVDDADDGSASGTDGESGERDGDTTDPEPGGDPRDDGTDETDPEPPKETENEADAAATDATDPAAETPEYEDDREDTPAIDEVDLSMDDVDDVSVPEATARTSDGEAVATVDTGDETGSDPVDDDGGSGPLGRLRDWLGGLFGGF